MSSLLVMHGAARFNLSAKLTRDSSGACMMLVKGAIELAFAMVPHQMLLSAQLSSGISEVLGAFAYSLCASVVAVARESFGVPSIDAFDSNRRLQTMGPFGYWQFIIGSIEWELNQTRSFANLYFHHSSYYFAVLGSQIA